MNQIKRKKLNELYELDFSIKEYQRAFEWEMSNIKSLVKSLSNNAFIGVITYKIHKEKLNSFIEVIDGQQRLTSLAIIFGGITLKIPNHNNDKFSFNFTDNTINELLNSILMWDEKKINANMEMIKNNGYLLKIYLIKNEWINYITDKKNQKELKTIKWLYEEKTVDFIDITDFNIEETFLRMNNNGIEVDFTSYAKASLLKKHRLQKSAITKSWNLFLDEYYKYKLSRKIDFTKDDAITQVLRIMKKRYDVKPTKEEVDNYSETNMFTLGRDYIEYASNELVANQKGVVIDNIYAPMYSNLFTKFNVDLFTLSFWWKTNLLLRDEDVLRWTILFGICSTFEWLANDKTNIEIYSTKANGLKTKTSLIKRYSFIDIKKLSQSKTSLIFIESILEYVKNKHQAIVGNWNENYPKKTWRIGNCKLQYRISSQLSRQYVFMRDTIITMIQQREKIEPEFLVKVIDEFIVQTSAAEMDESKLSYEHFFDKKVYPIHYGFNIKREINNNDFQGKSYSEKIKTLSKEYCYDFHGSPYWRFQKQIIKNPKATKKDFKKMFVNSFLI